MMRGLLRIFGWCAAICLISVAGCATTQEVGAERKNLVIVVPGVGGDYGNYTGVVDALASRDKDDCVRVSDWGSTWGTFLISISLDSWHQSAEVKLADEIMQWRQEHPGARVALVAHSAGAGVAMGALGKLKDGVVVGPVILLAPDLSPGFDLSSGLKHADVVHVFFSDGDNFFQGLGPSLVGTYDRVFGNGAGKVGFTLVALSDGERARVVQHAYEDQWGPMGCDGGHSGWLADGFVEGVLGEIIREDDGGGGDGVVAAGKSVGR